jgi:hypothetical protein
MQETPSFAGRRRLKPLMKHLIICREYPPAPGGGIGTYVFHISRLLADSGETVHVIGQLWEGAEKKVEEDLGGRLVIHRVPYKDWGPGRKGKPSLNPVSRLSASRGRPVFWPKASSIGKASTSSKPRSLKHPRIISRFVVRWVWAPKRILP